MFQMCIHYITSTREVSGEMPISFDSFNFFFLFLLQLIIKTKQVALIGRKNSFRSEFSDLCEYGTTYWSWLNSYAWHVIDNMSVFEEDAHIPKDIHSSKVTMTHTYTHTYLQAYSIQKYS